MAVFNTNRIKNLVKTKRGGVVNKGTRLATGSASWLKNATMSLGVSIKDVGNEMMPTTFESVKNITTEFSSMYSFLRDFKSDGGVDNLTNAFNNNEYTSMIKTAFSNIKSDLKSGNLNNKDREMEAFLGDMGDISDDEFSYNGEFDSTSNTDISNESISFGGEVESDAIADTFVAQTQAMTAGLKGVAEVNYSIGRTQLQVSKESFIQVGQGLRAINDNLALLVNYNNDIMTTYTQTSMKYYDDHMAAVKQQLEIQQKLMSPNAPPKNQTEDNPAEDLLYGGFSLEKFGAILKSNFKDYSNSNLALSMGKMMLGNTDMLKPMIANPIGYITQSVISSVIPNVMKETFSAVEESISNFIPALMMRFNRDKTNYSNPIMQFIGSLFGIKTTVKKTIDLAKYNNGPIPFDGETKKSIIEVIPGYLRKILAAVSGQEERIFDHNTNTFRTVKEVQDDFEKAKKNSALYEYSDSIDKIMEKASFLDSSSKTNFKSKVEDFMLKLSESDKLLDVFGLIGKGSGFDLKIQNGKVNKVLDKAFQPTEEMKKKQKEMQSTIKSADEFADLTNKANMNDTEANLLMEIIRSMKKGDVMKLFGRDVLSARSSMSDFMTRLEDDPNRFLAASILGEGKLPFNDHLEKEGTIKKGFGLFNPLDKFGKNSLDYLRNIQDILVDGIKVFIAGNTEGDTSHLHKYKNEKPANSKIIEEKNTGGNDITSKIANLTQEEIVNGIKSSDEKKEKEDNRTWLSKAVDNIIGKSSNETTKQRLMNVKEFFNKPMNMIQSIAKKIDESLFNIVFGKDDTDIIDPETGEIKKGTSFISAVGVGIAKFFDNTKNWVIEKIYKPLKESLFGKDGIITQIKDSKFYQYGKEKWEKGKDYIFGEKDEDGNRQNGIGSKIYNESRDILKGMAYYFTGKSYKKSTGETVPDNKDSVFGEMNKVFKLISTSIKLKWFGEKDEDGNYKEDQKGIITRGLDSLYQGFKDFGQLIFGNKFGSGDTNNAKEFAKKFKDGLPKSLAWGGIGATLSALSPLGFMGSLFLPGGMVGGAIVGMASGFLSQSESFKNWLFGPQDPNDMNNRMGGIISASTQKFLKDNKIHIAAGAGIGAIRGMMTGGGLLGSLFIGGPVGGALMGMGTAMIARSETFQRFMFGDLDENGNRNGGILSKLKFNFKSKNKDDNTGGRMVAGMLGGSALGAFISQFGILGSALTLGSGPLFGAVAGAAAGLSLSSKKFTNFMFGEIDEATGKRKGGIVTKTLNKMTVALLGPVRDAFDGFKIKAGEWFTDKILLPIQVAMDPVLAQFKFLGDAVKSIFSKTLNTLNNFIKDRVVTPIGTTLKMLLNPIGKLLKAGLGMGVKMGANLLATPFSVLEGVAGMVQGKQQKRGVKKYKKSIDEEYRETRNADKYRKGKLSEEDWRRSVQKKKGYMNDEEWSQYRDSYKDKGKLSKLSAIKSKYFDRDARREAMFGEEGAYYAGGKTYKERLKDIRQKNNEYFDKKRQKLEEQKAQTEMRRQYAEAYGYDNFDGRGNDKSFIYDPSTYFKKNEKTGEIEAWKDEAKTQQSKDTEDIKFNTDKLVDLVEKNSETNKEIASAINQKNDINDSSEPKSFADKATDIIKSNTTTMVDKLHDLETWLKVIAGVSDKSVKDILSNGGLSTLENDDLPSNLKPDIPDVSNVKSLVPIKGMVQGFNPQTSNLENSEVIPNNRLLPAPINENQDTGISSNLPAIVSPIAQTIEKVASGIIPSEDKKSLFDGKDVLEYQQEQEELKEKEKSEKFTSVMMDSIVAMREGDKKFHFEWSSIFGKKGLITAALIAGVPFLMKLYDLVKGFLGFGDDSDGDGGSGSGNPNTPGGPNEGSWINEDGTVTPIYNTQLRENLSQWAAKTGLKLYDKTPKFIRDAAGAVATTTGKVIKKGAKLVSGAVNKVTSPITKPIRNLTSKVVDRFKENVSGTRLPGKYTGEILTSMPNSKVTGEVVSNALTSSSTDRWLLTTGSTIASESADDVIDVAYREVSSNKGIVQAVASGSKSIIEKFKKIILEAFDAITTNKNFIKYLESSKSGSKACASALNSIVEKVLKSIPAKYTSRIVSAVAKFTATTAAELGTGGVAAIVFGVYDALTGSSKTEAANLFQVNQSDVDVLMRMISSAVKVVLGLGNLGPIADIFSEIFADVTGFNIKTWCATTFYTILSGDSEELKLAQEAFTKEYEKAIEETGNTNVSKQEYNNMVNKSWFAKNISDPVSKAFGWNDESVQSKFMDRDDFDPLTTKITLSDRLASATGSIAKFFTFGSDKVDKYVSNKVKSGFDYMKSMFTPKKRNAQGQAYNQAILSDLKKTVDEWNSMDCISEETRLSMADQEYWVMVENYMTQMGYTSPTQMTEEDMITLFGDYTAGELPDSLKKKYGLDQYNQPGYKWTIDPDTGEIVVHDIYDVKLPDDGSIRVNDETGMLEINYDNVPVIEGFKGRSVLGNIKYAVSTVGQAIKDTVVEFAKDPIGSIKKGASAIAKGAKSVVNAISTGITNVSEKVGEGLNSFDDKYLNGKGKEIASKISTKIEDIKEKAGEVWDDIKTGVDNVTDSTYLAGLKDDTVRETLGLDSDTKITLKDRFAVSVGGFLEGITGGKVEKEDSAKVIYGSIEMAQEKAKEIWTGLKDDFTEWAEKAKENIKKGLNKADEFLGSVFGFTDEKGEPMKLSEKVDETVDKFKEGVKELINDVKNFSFTDFWSNFKEDTKKKYNEFKEGIKTGITKTDMFLGNVLGFTNKNGEPMKLSEKVDETVDEFKEGVKETIGEIKSKASETWSNFKTQTKENFNKFTTNLSEGIKKTDMFLGNVFGFTDKNGNAMSLSDKVNEKTDEFKGVMTSMINNIKKTAEEGWKKFTEKLSPIIDAIKEIPTKIDEALGAWFSGESGKKLTTLVKEKLNVVGSFFSNLITSVKSFFGEATNKANNSINSRNTGSGTGKGIDTLEEMMYDKFVNMQGAGNTTTNNITNAKYVTCPNNITNNTISNNMLGKGPETTSTGSGLKITGKYGLQDKVHNFAYNSQSDPRWASYNYGLSPGVSGTTSNPTMAARACGPTAFSMVASQLNNQNYSPVEMADNFRKSGHSLPGGTTGAAMVDMAKKYGINGRYDSTTSAGIRNAITSNKPMILLGNRKSSDISSSPFTSGGHFVTAVGIAGNKVLINDPRGKSYSKAYDLNKVASETRAAWSYTGGNPTILPNSAYDGFSEDGLNPGSQAYKLKHKSDEEKVKIYQDLGWNEFTNYLNSKSITEPNDPITYKIDNTQYSGSGELSLSNYSSARMRVVQDAVNGLKNDGYLAAYSALYGNNDALVSLSNLDESTFKNTIDEFRAMSNDEFKDKYGVKLNPAELLSGNGGINTSYVTPNIRSSANHLVGLGEDYNTLTGLGPTGADIVASARKLIGKPYVYGGNYSPLGSSRGTDCSGLCQWAYNDNGIKISRTTYTQIKEGREVKKADLQPGDLVFSGWDGSNFQHVVLYAGNGKVIEAQKTGTTISERNLNWQSTSKARRILSDSAASGKSSTTTTTTTTDNGSEIVTTTTEAVSSNPTLFQKLTTAMSQVFTGVTNNAVYGDEYEGLDWDEINGITYKTTTEAKNVEGTTTSSDGSTSYGSDDTGKLLQNFHNLSGIFEVGGQSPSSISSFNQKSGYISNGASWGDAGGNSYGLPQFTIPTGSLKGFVNWLKTAHPDMGSKLADKTLGSTAFNNAWKSLASEAFKLAQWEYTDRNFFTPGLKSAQSKGVLNTDTITMKSVINSNAKAKGTADSMFGRIMKAGANKSLQPAITAMYQNVKDNAARDYRSSSASVQQSWRNRADKEKNYALAMAKREAPGKGGEDNDLLLGAGNLDSKLRLSPIENNKNILVGKGEIDPVNKFINSNRYKLEKLSKKTGKNLGFGSTDNISLKTPNKSKLYSDSKSYTSPVESFVNSIASSVSDNYSATMVDKELSLSTPSATTSNVREVLLSNNSSNNNIETLITKSLELLSSIASNTSDTVNAVKSKDLSVTVQQSDSNGSNTSKGNLNIIAPNGGNTSVNTSTSKDNSSNRNLERAMAIARGRF